MTDQHIEVQQQTELKPPYGLTAREWFEYKAKLSTKKMQVMNAVNTIPKNGYSEQGDYFFSREGDINDMMRKVLYENKLMFDVSFVSRMYRSNEEIVDVKLLITWTDTETGYFESHDWLASGMDRGEKGIYKAYTGGMKYFIMRSFLLSQGDTDPELSSMPKVNREEERKRIDQAAERQKAGGAETKADDKQPRTVQIQVEATDGAAAAVQKALKEKIKATEAPETPKEINTGAEPEKAAETKIEARKEQQSDPITSEQVGQIKLRFQESGSNAVGNAKKIMMNGVFESLKVRPELKPWGLRVKGITDYGEAFSMLTREEADHAISFLETWKKQREKKAQMNGELVNA